VTGAFPGGTAGWSYGHDVTGPQVGNRTVEGKEAGVGSLRSSPGPGSIICAMATSSLAVSCLRRPGTVSRAGRAVNRVLQWPRAGGAKVTPSMNVLTKTVGRNP